MEKIKLDIVALSHSVTQSHNYAVVLGEEDGNRRLPIVIGGFEAQAIAVAMEKMSPNRPLTHDLFRNTLESFDIKLIEIVINNLLDGIFYAQMICEKNNEKFEIDSRTSDAIAMAVRFDCPIYTYEFIMETAGVVLDDTEGTISAAPKRESPPKKKTLAEYSIEDLKTMLEKVLANEDYEKAALIRDELKNRT
jgi:bifunctional DNase/RNase